MQVTDAIIDLPRHHAECLAAGYRALIASTPRQDRPALLRQLRQQLKRDIDAIRGSTILSLRNNATRTLSIFNDHITLIANEP
jgi:hypothetical protein